MTADLVLTAVNAIADLLVVAAVWTVHRHRKTAFTRYLRLAFGVWLVADVLEMLVIKGVLSPHFVFYNLSTINSMGFLLAAAYLPTALGPRQSEPPRRWRSEWVNPATLAGLGVILLTIVLAQVESTHRLFAIPELIFALFVTLALGRALLRFFWGTDRTVAALTLVTFGLLAMLLAGYLLVELHVLSGNIYLTFKLLSVLAHMLLIFVIANVVARGLWRRLEAEQRALEQLIEGSPSAMLVVDEEGRVERINAATREALSAGAPTGIATIRDLLPGLNWTREIARNMGTVNILSDHLTVQRPTGERHVRVYGAPLSGTGPEDHAEDEPRRFVLIAVDIAAELERERVARESERASTLATLSGGTIHHFHNKLLAIRTGVRFLQSRLTVEETERLRLPLLLRATDQAFALSQQLAGSIRMAKEAALAAFDPRDLLAEATRDAAERKPVGYVVEVAAVDGERRPLLVRGVPGFMKMAFENLIVNAFDAARPGAGGRLSIELRATDDEAHVELRFRDDGQGIPEEARTQIFVPFFTTKETVGGTGFGLYWSRRLVESMGGSLTLESTEVGGGACFLLVLPLAREESGTVTQVAAEPD